MDELIFWFETPPKVSKGAFNFVANNWGNKVLFICNEDYPEYRKAANWDDGDYGKAELLFLSGQDDERAYIKHIFDIYPDAVHVISGFCNTVQFKIRPFLFRSGIKAVAFSEMPDKMGGMVESLIRELYFLIKYKRIHRLFSPYIKAFFPMGAKGMDVFARYNWDRDKMFPFMYCPVIHFNIEKVHERKLHTQLKFLFVGRFYFKTKGVDVLMNACDNLKGDWQLDMVGGYGKNKVEVENWIETHPKVNYLGKWDSTEVANRMSGYDVVVVPSRYDGWNLLSNESIYAGVGAIVTDKAVSDEIIREGNTGIIVKAGSHKELAQAMQYAIDNRNIVEEWKLNTANFYANISPETVGHYFIDVLKYTFYNSEIKPRCPWLKQ